MTYIESIGDFDEIDVHIYFSNTTKTKLFDYKVDLNDNSTAILISPNGKEYKTYESLRKNNVTGIDIVVRRFIAI